MFCGKAWFKNRIILNNYNIKKGTCHFSVETGAFFIPFK